MRPWIRPRSPCHLRRDWCAGRGGSFGVARVPSPDARFGHPCPPLSPRRWRFRPPGFAYRRGRLSENGRPLAAAPSVGHEAFLPAHRRRPGSASVEESTIAPTATNGPRDWSKPLSPALHLISLAHRMRADLRLRRVCIGDRPYQPTAPGAGSANGTQGPAFQGAPDLASIGSGHVRRIMRRAYAISPRQIRWKRLRGPTIAA